MVNQLDESISCPVCQRAPFESGDDVEISPVFAAEDFGKEFTPELRAEEERLRAAAARRS